MARSRRRKTDPRRYETLGYVLAGRAGLTIGSVIATFAPDDTYLAPANAEHRYRILETFSAIECTSPPAIAG